MFEALNKIIDRLESVAMVAFMTIATTVTTFQVVYRYGFNNSLSWAEEVGRSQVPSATLLKGARSSDRFLEHLGVDFQRRAPVERLARPRVQ